MKYLILLYFLFLGICASFAQITVQNTKEEKVEGIYVHCKTADNKEQNFLSDKNGKITFPKNLNYPCQITLYHVAYQPLQITLEKAETQTITLQESTYNIDDVVVTGQYEAGLSSQSLYNVRTISQERIQAQGALKLNKVLSNELGIRLNRDAALGTTDMQIQGIGGQNIKILIDGVPLIGRLGSSIDLEQINTNTIERIEIVEGPMAVNYGTNALAGVINIITKKGQSEKLRIQVVLQEESVGQEFSCFKEGIHNQNLQIGYQLNDNFYIQLDGGRNYFGGFQGNSEGRMRDWKPKTQHLANALVRFQKGNFDIFYRLDYLNEVIETLGELNEQTFKSVDEEYTVNRYIHQIQTQGKIQNFANLNLMFSYSDYERVKRRFVKDLTTLEETLTTASGDQDTSYFHTFNFRGTINNFRFLENHKTKFEIGYDLNLDTGGGGRIEGDNRTLNDYALFSSAEFSIGKNLKIRPALRWAYNSIYEAPLVPSVNFRYDLGKKWIFRTSYGQGFRAPSLRELYFVFVDANHNIFGNTALEPEYSDHIDAVISKQFTNTKDLQLKSELQGFYNDMRNRISIAGGFTDEFGSQAFRYINIDKFKTLGLTFRQEVAYKQLFARVGFAYIGRYQTLAEESENLKTFFYSPEINGQVSYKFPKLKSQINFFYKYTGRLENYQTDGNEVFIAKIDDYHWLDASITSHILKNADLTLGAKNLLNITDVNATTSGGVHGGGGANQVAYGRSVFLRIAYDFNIK